MTVITYHEFGESDFEALLTMGIKLWKEFDKEELKNLMEQSRTSGRLKILLAKNEELHYAGFVMASVRIDYVEGAKRSPTGYLEGIYVEPEFRKMGVARHLIEKAEHWLKQNNCSQIGSDTWLTDRESRNFHKKMGFWEEEEVVHFLKNLS